DSADDITVPRLVIQYEPDFWSAAPGTSRERAFETGPSPARQPRQRQATGTRWLGARPYQRLRFARVRLCQRWVEHGLPAIERCLQVGQWAPGRQAERSSQLVRRPRVALAQAVELSFNLGHIVFAQLPGRDLSQRVGEALIELPACRLRLLRRHA